MSIQVRFEKTIFFNPENEYAVIQVSTRDGSVPAKARRGDPRNGIVRFTAVGYHIPRNTAIELALDGHWENGKFGWQLWVDRWAEVVPRTPESVRAYLSCGLISHIGEKTAEAIVDRFGGEALDILENQPQRLLEVPGITPGRLEEILESYELHRDIQDLMTFLAPFKVSPKTAYRIQEEFGGKSLQIIREDPYALCRMSGFGFIRVDEIARKTGCPLDAPVRIRGALLEALRQKRSERGHLYMTVKTLCDTAQTMVNEAIQPHQRLPVQKIADELYAIAVEGQVIATEGAVYLCRDYATEASTADQIGRLLTHQAPPIDVEEILRLVMLQMGVTLAARQEEAVRAAFQSGLSIITGGPGTGKTTILRVILGVYRSLVGGEKIILCAPTGRASRRMAESTGFQRAKTLHKVLGIMPGDEEKAEMEHRPLDADLVIVDESSMMDMWLACQLFARIKEGTRVILVGDADQLPSVGPGNVLRELIDCGAVPVTVLDEVFRQSGDSRIARNARAINRNNDRLDYSKTDFDFIECVDQESAAELLVAQYLRELEQYGVEDIQVLSPFRTDGAASSDHLNKALQAAVNPESPDKPELVIGGRIFRLGDKVLQNKNKWEIFNGDVGVIREVKHGPGTAPMVTVEFPTIRRDYSVEDLSALELAYAMTVHKAMGSEYAVVLAPLLTAHTIQLYRNVFYTAVTRAKKKVVLVGQRKALHMAVHRKMPNRNSMLGKRVQAAYEKYRKELAAA